MKLLQIKKTGFAKMNYRGRDCGQCQGDLDIDDTEMESYPKESIIELAQSFESKVRVIRLKLDRDVWKDYKCSKFSEKNQKYRCDL